ncbi:MAG: hypothetical protein NWR87_05595 [Rhodospirillales bacterium]|nr:hypothetical protein [Rhodospirillales bacterium]
MTATNIALILTASAFLVFFFHPKTRNHPLWQATVTPLASIIGSGFLVAGPILAHAVGTMAWLAMTGLCAIAYLFGMAIRHNIVHVEPVLAKQPPAIVFVLERASEIALSLAYFVSVAYYLNLFAAFGLRFVDVIDPVWIQIVATVAISIIAVVGTLRGLSGLERFEVVAVGLKLSMIAGLFAALALASVFALNDGSFHWDVTEHAHGRREIGILLGLVILVQGFETSRYLSGKYDAATRVKTMRWAQALSSAVYLIFIVLITSYFTDRLSGDGGETAIIDMLLPVGTAIAPLIIIAALASQSSAAVADMNGAAGLLSEASGRRISVNYGNLITALVAVAITWTTNIYEIIAYASKAFVVYYALQSAQAAYSAWQLGQYGRVILFVLGVLIAGVVLVFAIPADV